VATRLTRRAGSAGGPVRGPVSAYTPVRAAAPIRVAAPVRVADQVFVDRSGRRRKVVVGAGMGLAVLALTALAAIGVGLVAGGGPGAVPGWPVAEHGEASGGVIGRSPAPGTPTPRVEPRTTPARMPAAPTSAGPPTPAPTATASVRPGRGQGRSNRPTHTKSPGKPG
jgi:hypothetical protein